MPKLKIQAVSVCVNYADFFVHVARENHTLFDKWVVVTDLKDTLVSGICAQYPNTQVVKTDVFYEKGIFNKYAGINEGLKLIDSDAWVLFLDSDIVLQKTFRLVLDNTPLDKEFLYGVDRLNCTGYEEWERVKKEGGGLLTDFWLLHSAKLELAARLVHLYGSEGDNGKFGGWNPLGFFHLCHRSAFDTYPQNALGADHCDLVFARIWPRNRRCLIPELLAIHLESDRAGGSEQGINWYGRKSLPFVLNAKKNLLSVIVSSPLPLCSENSSAVLPEKLPTQPDALPDGSEKSSESPTTTELSVPIPYATVPVGTAKPEGYLTLRGGLWERGELSEVGIPVTKYDHPIIAPVVRVCQDVRNADEVRPETILCQKE